MSAFVNAANYFLFLTDLFIIESLIPIAHLRKRYSILKENRKNYFYKQKLQFI